jgi:hypothetical protein
MSIRSGILAVLSVTDAYGLQLHGELEERTDRLGRINVGQIYSTLDRLVSAGLVRASGATDDGRSAAEDWLTTASVDVPDPWGDMTFKVLLAASLGHVGLEALIDRYRSEWTRFAATSGQATGSGRPAAGGRRGTVAASSALLTPGALARLRLADAALGWLDDICDLPGGAGGLAQPLRNERPRRGRRPAAAQQ